MVERATPSGPSSRKDDDGKSRSDRKRQLDTSGDASSKRHRTIGSSSSSSSSSFTFFGNAFSFRDGSAMLGSSDPNSFEARLARLRDQKPDKRAGLKSLTEPPPPLFSLAQPKQQPATSPSSRAPAPEMDDSASVASSIPSPRRKDDAPDTQRRRTLPPEGGLFSNLQCQTSTPTPAAPSGGNVGLEKRLLTPRANDKPGQRLSTETPASRPANHQPQTSLFGLGSADKAGTQPARPGLFARPERAERSLDPDAAQGEEMLLGLQQFGTGLFKLLQGVTQRLDRIERKSDEKMARIEAMVSQIAKAQADMAKANAGSAAASHGGFGLSDAKGNKGNAV